MSQFAGAFVGGPVWAAQPVPADARQLYFALPSGAGVVVIHIPAGATAEDLQALIAQLKRTTDQPTEKDQ